MSVNKAKKSMLSVYDDDQIHHSTARWVVIATAVTLLIALLWASFFQLDEITVAQGKIIPSSREQLIQSLDSGVLRELLVKEGQLVEKNQILLKIDDTRSGALFREGHEKWEALTAQAARLRAEAYGTALVFPPEIMSQKDIVTRERQGYITRKQALEESLNALRTSQALIERETAITEPQVKAGVISEVDLLRLKRQASDLSGQIAEKKNRYLTDASNELSKIESELSQTKENEIAREDAYKRSVMRAPMKGLIKSIRVTTIGGVIQAGQDILEIVPVDDQLLVEAYIKPIDVAFIKPGMAAVVKLSAYNFSKYGGLDGTVENISPDTLKDERNKKAGNPVELEEGLYRILVRTKKATLHYEGEELKIIPGMTASVDIKTGQKSVMEYVIRPLQKVSEALRER